MSVIAKYKFDKSKYENLIPVFNDGYTGYNISDIIEGNIVTRTIECNTLPTLMRFGVDISDEPTNRELSLLEVIELNTAELTNCNRMFIACQNVTSINTIGWTLEKVTSMYAMFYKCNKLISLDVSNFNTNNVTTMDRMFYYCENLTSLDVSGFNTSEVTTMEYMFYHCKKLTSLNVSNFNTNNVTNMGNMFDNCTSLTSLDVSNFNTGEVTNMKLMFQSCTSLSSLNVSNFNTDNVTNMYGMFNNCAKLTSLNVSNFNTNNVTNIGNMFSNCTSLTSLDISNFNTGKVTNMSYMFYKCSKLKSLDVSKWDTSKVDNMAAIFNGCRALTSLDVSKWDTSNVTTMAAPYEGDVTSTLRDGMFSHCLNLAKLDVSNWDTSKVTDMGGMFWSCNNLTSIDVSNWDTSNITTLTNMFDDCYNLIQIKGIENWIVDNVDNFNTTFNDCWKLKRLDLSRWNVKREARFTGTFASNYGASVAMNLVCLDIRNWEINGTNTSYTDKNTGESLSRPIITNRNTKLKYIRADVTSTVDWLASNVITRATDDPGYIITEAVVSNETIETFAAKNWNIVRLADMNTVDVAIYKFDKSIYKSLIPEFDNNFVDWFMDDVIEDEVNTPNIVTRSIRSMSGLPTLMRFGETHDNDMSNSLIELIIADTSNVINMSYMLSRCHNLVSIMHPLDTRNATDMQSIFERCDSLTTIDLSNFNTSNVTNMSYMFASCQSLTSLNISNWNTNNVTTMESMFNACNKLTSLDIGSWNVSSVTTMYDMFEGCRKLESIDLSNWNPENLKNTKYMFNNCQNITSINVESFNFNKIKDCSYMFYNCINLQLLDLSNCKIGDAFRSNLFSTFHVDSNIGMIYSDQKTIESVANRIKPSDKNTTIWVGNHIDISTLPQYDHITYKVYEVEDELEVELSSPLLEGDRLEIIDGDLYHYHEMGMVEYDGSDDENWIINGEMISCKKPNNACNGTTKTGMQISNRFKHNAEPDVYSFYIGMSYVNIYHPLYANNVDGFKIWLKANPVTIVYGLQNPYYELVKPNVGLLNAKQGLYLSISDSVVPINYQFDLCTMKLNYLLSNTLYKVSFKSNKEGEISINLGGTLSPFTIIKGLNEITLTTPATLEHEELHLNGPSDIKISNVMVVDSEKDFDYFKGMNNNFDEIPVNNICSERTLAYVHGTDEEGKSPQYELIKNVEKGKLLTVVGKVSNNPNSLPISINLYCINNEGKHPRAYGKNKWIFGDILYAGSWYSTLVCKEFELPAGTYTIHSTTEQKYERPPWMTLEKNGTGEYYAFPLVNGKSRTMVFEETISDINLYSNGYNAAASNNNYIYFTNIQIEEGTEATAYEPPEFNVNNEPILINPDENGNFVFQIKADRDYVNRIGFDVGDISTLETDDIVQITDFMVFEGDFTDCYPTTWQDFDKTRYLAEFISYNNEYGFGKNRLI